MWRHGAVHRERRAAPRSSGGCAVSRVRYLRWRPKLRAQNEKVFVLQYPIVNGEKKCLQ